MTNGYAYSIARLVSALRAPATTVRLSLREWSELVATARVANLLGLLAERCRAASIPLPPEVEQHLSAHIQLSERQRRAVCWEVHSLQRALEPLGIPVVLLKGAAYAMSGNPVSRGRLFGDIDILVPREALPRVELKLMVAGWASAKTDAYDQRYYRRWMHELPPMINVRRGTVLDVHHTILPLTSRHAPDAGRIMRDARPLPGLPTIRVPRPEHLLIHSLVHLLHEGELHNGLRDLFDIDGLIRAFVEGRAFWDALVAASAELDVAQPVYFGLLLAHRLVGAPVPPHAFREFERRAGVRGPSASLTLLYRAAIEAGATRAEGALPALATFAIYVRAHWLRMPPYLLIPHLARKALMQFKKDEPALVGRA